MKHTMHSNRGVLFLLGIVITVMIISILAALAHSSYQNYKRRIYYTNVVEAPALYRVAVGECVQKLGKLLGCNAGTHNIPPAITKQEGVVSSLNVADGVITVTPVPAEGITERDTYIVTPIFDARTRNLTWAISGAGVAKGYVQS